MLLGTACSKLKQMEQTLALMMNDPGHGVVKGPFRTIRQEFIG